MPDALRYRWYIFWIFAIQYLLLFFHRVCTAVLAPELVAAFNISGTALGFLSAGYFYPYALMQIPVGMLSDSFGPRKTATVFGALGAFGSILFGLSPYFGFAIFSRVLIGFGVSAVFVPAMTVYAQWFKGKEYARISGLLVAIGGIGWLAGAAPLAFITQVFDWRTVFVFIGVLTLVLTGVTWLVVADSPDKKGFSSVAEPGVVRASSAGVWRGLAMLWKEKYFWALAPWYFMRTGVLFAFAGLWAGPYLMDVHKLSKLATGNLLSIVPIAIIVGSPFLGYLSDKVFVSRKVILVGSSILHSACWIVLLLYLETISIGSLCVILFLIGIGSGSPGSVGFANVKEVFPSSMAGTAIGAANTFAFLGGVVLQPLIGYVLDLTGRVEGAYPASAYRTAFWVFFGASVVALVSVLFSKETIGREKTVLGSR